MLWDTADRVTTLDSEDDLRGRVVEKLVHLTVTNTSGTVKSLTRCLIEYLQTVERLLSD